MPYPTGNATTYSPSELVGKQIRPINNRHGRPPRLVERLSANRKFLITKPATGEGRTSRISVDRLVDYEVVVPDRPAKKASSAKKATKPPVLNRKPLTERESALLRIIKSKFSDFHRRQQHFYLLQGMSTTHVGWSMFADAQSVKLFWPKDLIQEKPYGRGTTYIMQGEFGRRIQATVTDTLKTLHQKGYLEKLGNSDERRWKPIP